MSGYASPGDHIGGGGRQGYAPPGPPPRRSVFWPILLIGLGVVLLLYNLGMLPAIDWAVLWKLWPLLLIALGVDVMIGRQSAVGAVISAIVVLALVGCLVAAAFTLDAVPQASRWLQPGPWRYEHFRHPLEGTEYADLLLTCTAVPCTVTALDVEQSGALIEADVASQGEVHFDVESWGSKASVILESEDRFVLTPVRGDAPRWEVHLHPRVVWTLRVDSSAGHCRLDLRGMQVERLSLDLGSGGGTVYLPRRHGFKGKIDGGSGAVTLVVPEDVGLRVELDGGSGAFRPGEELRLVEGDADDGAWESVGYDTAEVRILLKIDQGSGAVSVRWE